MRKLLALFAVGLALIASPAAADWTGKDATGATITFFNAGTCTSVVCVPVAALVNAAGATAYGTAGSSNAAVLSVQGIASGTALPISGSLTNISGTISLPTGAATAANQSTANASLATIATNSAGANPLNVNAVVTAQTGLTPGVAQTGTIVASNVDMSSIVGTATAVNSGNLSAGTQRNVLATNSPALPAWGHGATGAAVPAGATYMGFNSGGNLTAPSTSAPMPVRPGDGTRNAIVDPCEGNLQTYATGVITSGTTTRIIAPSASNKTYLCAFFMKASAADNVAMVEGTGGTCGTGTAALLGGTTTANGFVFGTAGDGVLLQAGGKVAIVQTAGTNVDTCLITSTAGPLIWSAKYVQAP